MSAERHGAVHARLLPGHHDRDGLIVDARNNGSGNIDAWVLRPSHPPLVDVVATAQQPPIRQHAVRVLRQDITVLVNRRTASNSGRSPGFRRLRLGKVIGTRTWGRGDLAEPGQLLVDRSIADGGRDRRVRRRRPLADRNHGVDPDLTVDNAPRRNVRRPRRQLETAVKKYLMGELARDPVKAPGRPAVPEQSGESSRHSKHSRGGGRGAGPAAFCCGQQRPVHVGVAGRSSVPGVGSLVGGGLPGRPK